MARKNSLLFCFFFWLLLFSPSLSFDLRQAERDDALKLYAVNIFRAPKQSWPGYGIHLGGGRVITAAHVLAGHMNGNPTALIAGQTLEARMDKQGDFDGTDITLLSVDPDKLPAHVGLRKMPLCEAAPRPGQDVVVAVPEAVVHSHILSAGLLPSGVRERFNTVISDVASTGNSGSGVFDADSQCLLGIMSRKIQAQTMVLKNGVPTKRLEDVAKYFVPAAQIRDFLASP
jgi:hypothetical protein